MVNYVSAYYVVEFLRPSSLDAVIKRCVEYLQRGKFEFDTIAFRGMSGAVVAPPIALAMGKELIMVRKGESTHSSYDVEGNADAKRVLIIDDLVASGGTARAVRKGVREIAPTAEIIGVLEYTQMHYASYQHGTFLNTWWMSD
jgi:adenine/guanine phosphoribosyltransferase-like PRPP-binding protein